jgi:oxygen-independent coproporphyrinogen-3 oxidase
MLSEAQRELFVKYSGLSLPRHTSYPAANFWQEGTTPSDYQSWLQSEWSDGSQTKVGLYIHIPFCRSLCSYCGCTREVIPDELRNREDPSFQYLEFLKQERDQLDFLGDSPVVDKIHLGGGTPTFLRPEQLLKMWNILRIQNSHGIGWRIEKTAELAAEIDPRVTTREHLQVLWELGFRRLSLGIQDFDGTVQKKINRIQPLDVVQKCVEEARSIGFRQINFDLIYGLPNQTEKTIAQTLTKVVSLRPSRIAFYRLAVMPEIFKWQKSFSHEDLPGGYATLDMILMAVGFFRKFGYQFIGFDHFALPEDPLHQDYENRRLVRNFQGMTTGGSSMILGMGPSAISSGKSFYVQNHRSRADWIRATKHGLPVARGIRLNPEEQKRRDLIASLYCYGEIQILNSGLKDGELERLELLCQQGLLVREGDQYLATFLGQLLSRVIGSALDPFLPEQAWSQGLRPGRNSATG